MIALQAQEAKQLQTVLEEQACTSTQQEELHAAPEGQEAEQLAGRPGDEAAAAAKGQLPQARALMAPVAWCSPGPMQKCMPAFLADRLIVQLLAMRNCTSYRQAPLPRAGASCFGDAAYVTSYTTPACRTL